MSSSNSPALVLELPSGWRRLIPAGTLLITALLLPKMAFTASPVISISCMLSGTALAVLAGWQAGIGCAARRLTRVAWGQNGEWRVQFAVGEPVSATLAASSWWSAWVMCWRLVDENGRSHGLLLWRPEFAPGSWHQWQQRLRLEWAGDAAAAGEPLR
jgi:hypothetical protein